LVVVFGLLSWWSYLAISGIRTESSKGHKSKV
jgi:hypothetical protein